MARRPTTSSTDTSDQVPTEGRLSEAERIAQEEARVIVGGPGAESAATEHPEQRSEDGQQTDDEFQEIEVAGRKLRVSKEDAEAIQTEFEVRELRARQAAPAPVSRAEPVRQPTQSDDPLAGIDDMLFADPRKAIDLVGKVLESRVLGRVAEQTQAQQKGAAFWDSFYRENKELDREKDHFLIEAVLARELPRIGDMPQKAAAVELANLAKAEILRYGGATGRARAPSRDAVEGPSHAKPPSAANRPQPDEGPRSISQVLARRRAMRNKQISLQ